MARAYQFYKTSIPRIGFAYSILMLLSACVSTAPPDDIACKNSDTFRLSVETAPIAELLLREHLTVEDAMRAAMRVDSVEGAIAGAMSMDGETVLHYKRHNIAVLSGGGEFGAYGAGLFQSYLNNGGDGIVFDVVTGVSTGALQATGVFLGGDSDLDDLVEAYAIEREEDLATRRRSLGNLPLETSIYSLDPARERFSHFLTDERIARVAAAARDGRKLLVGVVEVQDGQFYAFDLTAIAASGRPQAEIRQCYTEAVFASAAVPVVFPPILLDGKQYFDGGVRASVFLDSTVNALQAVSDKHAEAAKVYVLFNGYLDTPRQDELAVSITDAVARTRSIAFDQIDRASLQTIALLKDRFDVNWARIAPRLCDAARDNAPDEDIFNTPFMNCLIREGQREGAKPKPFQKIE